MDFLEFYKLKEHPFSSSIDSRFYFNSSHHAESLLRLKYAADTMKGLAVVVGGVGTGKSTLARRMLDDLDETVYEAALLLVLHASVTADWLMKKIAMQLGVKNIGSSKLEVLGQVARKLHTIHDSGRKTVILVDEVQMLKSQEIMEELRGLLNMEVPMGKLITLVLFGMPEIEDVLSLDLPLKQRIAVKCKLNGFERNITEEYVKHRLKVAACQEGIFDPEAIQAIHSYSHGIPRLINTICDNSIFEGFLIKAMPIGRDVVESVAKSLDLHPAVEEAEEYRHFG
jgi:general secretion pathway protein A